MWTILLVFLSLFIGAILCKTCVAVVIICIFWHDASQGAIDCIMWFHVAVLNYLVWLNICRYFDNASMMWKSLFCCLKIIWYPSVAKVFSVRWNGQLNNDRCSFTLAEWESVGLRKIFFFFLNGNEIHGNTYP